MSFAARRTLTAVAVIGAVGAIGLGLILAMSSCDAPQRAIPASSVIVVPNSEQVTGTIDTSRMDWLSRFAGTESGPVGR